MTVEPWANVSGSTSVACWLDAFVNGSLLIRVDGTFAAEAGPAMARRAVSAMAAAAALSGEIVISRTVPGDGRAVKPCTWVLSRVVSA
jgi:hypothetical protein